MAIDTPLAYETIEEDDSFDGEAFARWYTDNGGYELSDMALECIFRNELTSYFGESGMPITVESLDEMFREYPSIRDWALTWDLLDSSRSDEALWEELDRRETYHIIGSDERILTCL